MKLFSTLSLAAMIAAAATGAWAAPVLKANVVVKSPIVTVGDMFDDAGAMAEEPLFRAPLPGSAGTVTLADVEAAASRIGLAGYIANGVSQVRVARTGVPVTQDMLNRQISADLQARGVLTRGMTAEVKLDSPYQPVNVEASAEPVQLVDFNYQPSGRFSASFSLAGRPDMLNVQGTIARMMEAPHLTRNIAAGAVLTRDDIEMRPIPAQYADNATILGLDELVGKQVQRQSRQGMVLKASDVTDPQIIARNELVTVYFRQGSMQLSVKGVALNAAGKGQPVSVLNTSTKKVLQGLATDVGQVEIVTTQSINVAGL